MSNFESIFSNKIFLKDLSTFSHITVVLRIFFACHNFWKYSCFNHLRYEFQTKTIFTTSDFHNINVKKNHIQLGHVWYLLARAKKKIDVKKCIARQGIEKATKQVLSKILPAKVFFFFKCNFLVTLVIFAIQKITTFKQNVIALDVMLNLTANGKCALKVTHIKKIKNTSNLKCIIPAESKRTFNQMRPVVLLYLSGQSHAFYS